MLLSQMQSFGFLFFILDICRFTETGFFFSWKANKHSRIYCHAKVCSLFIQDLAKVRHAVYKLQKNLFI